MRVRPSLSGQELCELEAALKRARTVEELRRALSVWMPAALGLTAKETARALACDRASVRHARRSYRAFGLHGLRPRWGRPLEPEPAARVEAALERAGTVEELRRILCVWLPALLGLSDRLVAKALGWSRARVVGVRGQYLRGGPEALAAPGGVAAPGSAAQSLEAALKNARSVADYRRAQCLFLRVTMRFGARQVARIIGWGYESVCHLHRQYLREGDAVLRASGRGRARWRLLSAAREAAVLRRVARHAWSDGMVQFTDIHQAFEQEAGHPVKTAVIHEILERHGWSPGLIYITSCATRTPEVYREPWPVRRSRR